MSHEYFLQRRQEARRNGLLPCIQYPETKAASTTTASSHLSVEKGDVAAAAACKDDDEDAKKTAVAAAEVGNNVAAVAVDVSKENKNCLREFRDLNPLQGQHSPTLIKTISQIIIPNHAKSDSYLFHFLTIWLTVLYNLSTRKMFSRQKQCAKFTTKNHLAW
jgi:hypothetical protein